MSIELGAVFSTFQDFTLALKKHEKECGVLYVTSSSKRLRKDLRFADTLKYDYARFVCKQGRRTKESSSEGIRPNQTTYKTGCPALINIILVADGDSYKLKITTCNVVHENHPTGQEFSKFYPENRGQKFKLKRRLNISGHQKLKQVLSAKALSTEVVSDRKYKKPRRDSFYKTCLDSMKIKYNTKYNSDIVNAIQNDLTPSAAKLVTEQFHLSQRTQYLHQSSPTSPDTYKVTATTPGSCHYECTAHSCSCDFFSKFHLTCQHIFALRSELGLLLYYRGDEILKSNPTSPSISTKVHRATPEVLPARNDSAMESCCQITKEITQAMESVLPSLGEHAFRTAIANLNKVLSLIKSGRPLAVIDLSEYIVPSTQTSPDNMCSTTVSKLTSETQTINSSTKSETINVVVEFLEKQ